MKRTSLIAMAIAAVSWSGQPAFCQNYDNGTSRVVIQNQTGLINPSSTYIGNGTLSQSAQGGQAGAGGSQFKGVLPAVPMGTVIGTAGDHVGRVQSAPVSAPVVITQPTRNGLQPTNMSAAVGMPGDHVGQQSAPISQGSMRNGLQPTRFGAAFGMPGDSLRSDLRGTPMYNDQVRKQIQKNSVQRSTRQTAAPVQSSGPQFTATYKDSYQRPKRNY